MKQMPNLGRETISAQTNAAGAHLTSMSGALPEGEAFGTFVQFLKRRGWLIVAAVLLGLLVAVVMNLLMPKLYTAFAHIEIANDRASQFQLGPTQGTSAVSDFDAEELDTEIQILQSRTLALETIQSLHLEKDSNFLRLKNGQPWNISSPAVRDMLIGTFESDLDVERLGHTSLIAVRVTTPQPALSSLIANTLVDNYIEHSFRVNYASTVKISAWLSSQLNGLKKNLEKSQAQMIAYQKKLGVLGLVGSGDNTTGGTSGGISSGGNILVSNLEEMNNQLALAEVDRMVKQAQLQALESSSPGVLDTMLGVSDPVLQANRESLAQLSSEYTSMRQTYGPGYPEAKALKARISDLQGGIKKEESAAVASARKEYDAAVANEAMLKKALDSGEQVAFGKEEEGAKFEFAREDYEANRLLYDGLQERLLEAGVLAGLHSTAIHIVDDADVPAFPSHPRKTINLALGLGVGLMLGFGLSLVFEGLDTTLKSMIEIERELQLPVLAAVPSADASDLLPKTFREQALLTGSTSWSGITEALRGLRTSILLSSPGAAPKVIEIVSTRPAEGKTSVATLLAVAFALGGSRVLLIDADLRRPSVHLRFDIPRTTGLSSVLSGKTTLKDSIAVPWSDLPGLNIMTAGPVPPLPSELLGSQQMETLLQTLREEYDTILIDTPPVLAVTDAALIARRCDATVLILRYGTAQKHVVQRCIDVLDRSDTHLLGTVVNAVNLKSPEYSEYYGRKYYEYYGERDGGSGAK